MKSEKLVRMANQIATFFAHEGAEKAPLSVADHLQKFWEPRMRAQLLAAVAALEPVER
jgi:formate dehydrogenase subunit delta